VRTWSWLMPRVDGCGCARARALMALAVERGVSGVRRAARARKSADLALQPWAAAKSEKRRRNKLRFRTFSVRPVKRARAKSVEENHVGRARGYPLPLP